MGVYIKGMEMPTSCGLGGADGCGCPCFCAYNEQCQLLRRRIDTAFIKGTPLPSDCPLVPVPPHGDLIDQDEYRDEFMNGVYKLCSDDSDNYRANAIIDLFDDAPTIIPAEEVE